MTEHNRAHPQRWTMSWDRHAIVWLEPYPPNIGLDGEALAELGALLAQARERDARALVLRLTEESASEGTDLALLRELAESDAPLPALRELQGIFSTLAGLPIPTVAIIDGVCEGVVLELALACRYRLCSDRVATRLAFTELQLGVHPLGGTTVRLPHLVGSLHALELFLEERILRAWRASEIGLVDRILPQHRLRAAATAMALQNRPLAVPPLSARLSNVPWLRPFLARRLHRQYLHGLDPAHDPAPFALVELWERQSITDAERAEAESLIKLVRGEPARNRLHVAALSRRLRRQTQGHTPPRHVHIVGAGAMGRALAVRAAMHGMRVTLEDRTPRQLAAAIRYANLWLEKELSDREQVAAAIDRLHPDLGGRGASRADLLIEAVDEDLEIKLDVLRQLDSRLASHAVIASTTTSLPLNELAGALSAPRRLVGLHFSNAAALAPLVELATLPATTDSARRLALGFVNALELAALPVAASAGYLLNRCLDAFLNEATILFDEGIDATTIDQAALRFGMRQGPLEMADRIGLDREYQAAQNLAQAHGHEPSGALALLVENGRLGRKTGAGFYDYKAGEPVRVMPDLGHLSLDDISDRLIYRLLNEAIRCLREKVVADAELIDAGMVLGAGFPAFRGGPVRYLTRRGVEASAHRLRELASLYGPRFEPDPGWEALAALEPAHS